MRVHLKHMGGLLLSGLLFTIASAKDLKLDCGDTTVWFSPQNGSITRISNRNETLSLKSNALFSAQANQKEIYPNGAACNVTREGEKIVATYRKAGALIQVTAIPGKGYLDLQAEVKNGNRSVIKDFHLPARIYFNTGDLDRFIMPGNGMFSVGFALEPKFFQQAPLTAPIGYRQVIRGEAGFRKTLGGKLKKMDFQKTSPTQLYCKRPFEQDGRNCLLSRVDIA